MGRQQSREQLAFWTARCAWAHAVLTALSTSHCLWHRHCGEILVLLAAFHTSPTMLVLCVPVKSFLLLQHFCSSSCACTCLSFVSLHVGSPWYNRTGWLGVKHQLTYSPCWPVQRVGFVDYKFHAGQLSDPCQELILHHLLVPFLHMHRWWVCQSVFVHGSVCVTDFHPVDLLDLKRIKSDPVNALCK